MAETSHRCGRTWEAAEPPAQGGPSFRDGAPSHKGGGGSLCWADGLLCGAHRPEREEREETAAEEAQATGRSQRGTAGIQGTETARVSHAPRRPWQPRGTGDGPGSRPASILPSLLVRHPLLSTNCTAFGKAGASKEHFFLKQFFLLIASQLINN